MPLVVEDGSIVFGANSYISLVDFKSFAKDRNVDISAFDTAALTGFAFDAMDYIESFRDKFKGAKSSAAQALQWPRTVNALPDANVWFMSLGWSDWTTSLPLNIQIDGFDVLPNVIPPILKTAQCLLMIERCKGTILFPTSSPNRQVKVKVIGPLRTEYFSSDATPSLPSVDIYMQPLMISGGSVLRTVRV